MARPGLQRALTIALATLVAVGVVVSAFYLRAPRATRVKVGDPAPPLFLRPVAGGPLAPLPLLGKSTLLLVLFDSSWSVMRPYLRELERVNRRYGRRGLVVVGVCMDLTGGPAVVAAAEAGVTFPFLHDPGGARLRETYDLPAAPASYVIAPSGMVVALHQEPVNWRLPENNQAFERLLDPEVPGRR